jgi:hypothetical protein
MTQLLLMAIDESTTRRSGGETVLSKLAELMFVDVVRSYIAALPRDTGGWLSGLRDPCISRALALMHGRPSEAWTLERLAHEVGLSRSVFADGSGRVAEGRDTKYAGDSNTKYNVQDRIQVVL